MSTTRAVSDLAVMSPNPTVVNTVTVKYKASVRVIGWVKLAAEFPSITKYVEANSSRKNGRIKASASAARTPGYREPVMILTAQTTTPATTSRPISSRTAVSESHGRSSGST
jgi:hypothetical protein